MMEWWEQPYKGGPMVVVKGFPRSMYPPDASWQAKMPSSDGPDVIAYKRTVSRLGRWPWDPPGWDDTYSNGFAHGKTGGNVGDSGVAGVQRQQSIDATGWIGKTTFNLLRSARCPVGPHEGEMAMDSVAVSLVNEAFDLFHGGPGVPDLGPVFQGGRSVLDQDLTHITSNIDVDDDGVLDYPAFDDAFNQGVSICAPEDLTVTRQSSSNPGHAFYADGASKLKWWFGHLDRTPAVGTKFKKGGFIGLTCANTLGGGPHVHVGIDARPLIGKMLEHHTNYTHGAPTVGIQLREALD